MCPSLYHFKDQVFCFRVLYCNRIVCAAVKSEPAAPVATVALPAGTPQVESSHTVEIAYGGPALGYTLYIRNGKHRHFFGKYSTEPAAVEGRHKFATDTGATELLSMRVLSQQSKS